MDMRKMQVRAELERMIINYSLMNRIETREADQIISCLNRVIGYAPIPQASRRDKIIPFLKAEAGEQKPREPSESAGETPWELCLKISEELGLREIKYLGYRILTAISRAGIKNVEELARYPLDKLAYYRGVGEKAVSAIKEALKTKGYKQEEMP
jgi:DNA-directed RNA polymerase alpha subunit